MISGYKTTLLSVGANRMFMFSHLQAKLEKSEWLMQTRKGKRQVEIPAATVVVHVRASC